MTWVQSGQIVFLIVSWAAIGFVTGYIKGFYDNPWR